MTTNVSFLKRAVGALRDCLERSGQDRARAYLLGLSDSYLRTMGLSRKLIEQGPAAWPWRKDDQIDATSAHAAMQALKPVGQPLTTSQDRDQAPNPENRLAA